MRPPDQHILFLVTEFDAHGMRPYACTIISMLWQAGDQVLIVSRGGFDNQAIPGIPADAITWIDYPTGKVSKAIFRFHPTRVLNAIDDIISRCDISLIYSLTEEIILADSINQLQRKVPVLYTVHDASFHEYKFRSPVRWLKDRIIIARPQRLMMERTSLQITNSRVQRDDLSSRFPYHKVYYAPFPTLVNDAISQGNATVPELESVPDGYILFFGTLHLYKGVHLLYDAYLSHPGLQDRPLVIAGTKSIYFERSEGERNVTFINRYIDDSELKHLFSRASLVVYPYTSATQSGVTSIASFFGKPLVLSDLPFFKDTCEGCEGVEFFPRGDAEALAAAIDRALHSPASTRPLYDQNHSPEALHAVLTSITTNIMSTNLTK